jgi:hypothetical protein
VILFYKFYHKSDSFMLFTLPPKRPAGPKRFPSITPQYRTVSSHLVISLSTPHASAAATAAARNSGLRLPEKPLPTPVLFHSMEEE